jgi:hypothetical protein
MPKAGQRTKTTGNQNTSDHSAKVRYTKGARNASKRQDGDQDLKILHSYFISKNENNLS